MQGQLFMLMGMSRLPELKRDQLSAAGQAVWDLLVETRGGQVVTAEGTLRGPFNAFLHAPDVGGPLASLGAVLRYGTSFGRGLTELAIITVAARWQAEQLSAGSLTAAISDAVNRRRYRGRALEIANRLATEDGTLAVIRALDRLTAWQLTKQGRASARERLTEMGKRRIGAFIFALAVLVGAVTGCQQWHQCGLNGNRASRQFRGPG
jgi:hypothetical protein